MHLHLDIIRIKSEGLPAHPEPAGKKDGLWVTLGGQPRGMREEGRSKGGTEGLIRDGGAPISGFYAKRPAECRGTRGPAAGLDVPTSKHRSAQPARVQASKAYLYPYISKCRAARKGRSLQTNACWSLLPRLPAECRGILRFTAQGAAERLAARAAPSPLCSSVAGGGNDDEDPFAFGHESLNILSPIKPSEPIP